MSKNPINSLKVVEVRRVLPSDKMPPHIRSIAVDSVGRRFGAENHDAACRLAEESFERDRKSLAEFHKKHR